MALRQLAELSFERMHYDQLDEDRDRPRSRIASPATAKAIRNDSKR
jgi:hypothetical protein